MQRFLSRLSESCTKYGFLGFLPKPRGHRRPRRGPRELCVGFPEAWPPGGPRDLTQTKPKVQFERSKCCLKTFVSFGRSVIKYNLSIRNGGTGTRRFCRQKHRHRNADLNIGR